jgi:sterol desaturase/sphingolipid hydroxylase (fatty acid hydroxylase superfamily)
MFDIITALVIGAACWTFAEYGIHHWVGHLGRGKNPFSREHLSHHRTGEFTEWTRKYFQAALVVKLLGTVSVLIAGWPVGLAWTLGFCAAYGVYEFTHRRLHTHPPQNAYGRMLRRHHFSHHFSSAKYNHGVTSRFWDHIFRTYSPLTTIKVPKRLAMSWLVDEHGAVLPAYAGDYQIR